MSFFNLAIIFAAVFVMWVVVAFAILFGQRARVQAKTGKLIPGVGDVLSDWRHWWRSPDLRRQRIAFIALTLAQVILIAAFFALQPSGI